MLQHTRKYGEGYKGNKPRSGRDDGDANKAKTASEKSWESAVEGSQKRLRKASKKEALLPLQYPVTQRSSTLEDMCGNDEVLVEIL